MAGTDHFVAASDEDRHRPGVGTFLNHEHLLPRRAKCHFPHSSSLAELLGTEILKSRHYPAVGGDSNQLNLGTANPPHGRELVLQQKVVCLVVETPLADSQVRAGVLDLLNHLDKLLLLVVLQLLELLNAGDVKVVLGLGLRRLESTGQDGNLRIVHLRGHLRMREILINDHALDKQRIFKSPSNLSVHLDQLEINVFPLEVGNGQDGVHSNIGKLVVGLGDNLATQTCPCDLDQVLSVVLGKVNDVRNLVELRTRDITGLVVAVGDSDGVDALVDKVGSLFQ